MSEMSKKVRFAYYGGVDLNNVFKVKDVTAHLQGWLDAGNTTIQPNPGPFVDPFSGTHKGFYAELDWGDGTTAVFLCTDNGQTIDFSQKPVPQPPSSTVPATGTIIVKKAWLGTSLPGKLGTFTQSQQDITGALQALINNNARSVSMWALPDPAQGHHKALYADISNNGTSYVYMHGGYFAPAAGAAKDPIDFTKPSLAPSVASFLPINVIPGMWLSIKGKNLIAGGRVNFAGGVSAVFDERSTVTEAYIKVPAGAQSGTLYVTCQGVNSLPSATSLQVATTPVIIAVPISGR
jgi:hypothetical protein